MKVSASLRATGTIGLGGIGFAWLSPAMSNDADCLFVSGATYAGAWTPTSDGIISASNTLATGVTSHQLVSLPFNTSTLITGYANDTQPIQGRLVCAGLKVSYAGSSASAGGLIRCVTSTARLPIGNLSLSYLDSLQSCSLERFSPSREYGLNVFPVSEEEKSFTTTREGTSNTRPVYPLSGGSTYWTSKLQASPTAGVSAVFGTAGVNMPCPIAGIIITGAPGQPFLVELVEHLEFIGSTVSYATTKNDIDVDGSSSVIAAAATVADNLAGSDATSPAKYTSEFVKDFTNNALQTFKYTGEAFKMALDIRELYSGGRSRRSYDPARLALMN